MAITYPLDLLANFPGWTTEFDLAWRQEQSRQANGRTIVKDMGSPLWRATYQSRTLKPNELDEWRARLTSLENGLQQFRGYPLSRCRPIAHPGNGSLPTGALSAINSNRKAIAASGMVGVRLSVGDMVQIGDRDLHQVMEPAVAGTAGQLPGGSGARFEVRPHLWPGVATGAAFNIVRPSCLMTIVPGSVSSSADASTGRGAISFQAIEAR